jgi:hypothetical protein
LVVSAMLSLSCGDSGKSDCEEANPPAKTKQLGESCLAFTYGTCPTVFDDCADGSCLETKNGKICTRTCATYADCPSGLLYCPINIPASARVCTPGATCETVCDGATCCSYSRDPNDPTSCLQGSCTTT